MSIHGAQEGIAGKEHVEHLEHVTSLSFDSDIFQPESSLSKYIPGGYSKSRCLKLEGRPMIYADLALAGCAIMFFGFDASVMSQVNTNSDYLRPMGADSGSDRESATVGGIVGSTFVLFAALNFAMLVPIYLFYIETANRNFEVMDLLFSSDSVFAWRAERDYKELKAREAVGSEMVKEDQA